MSKPLNPKEFVLVHLPGTALNPATLTAAQEEAAKIAGGRWFAFSKDGQRIAGSGRSSWRAYASAFEDAHGHKPYERAG